MRPIGAGDGAERGDEDDAHDAGDENDVEGGENGAAVPRFLAKLFVAAVVGDAEVAGVGVADVDVVDAAVVHLLLLLLLRLRRQLLQHLLRWRATGNGNRWLSIGSLRTNSSRG